MLSREFIVPHCYLAAPRNLRVRVQADTYCPDCCLPDRGWLELFPNWKKSRPGNRNVAVMAYVCSLQAREHTGQAQCCLKTWLLNSKSWGLGCSSVVEHVAKTCEALDPIPCTSKKYSKIDQRAGKKFLAQCGRQSIKAVMSHTDVPRSSSLSYQVRSHVYSREVLVGLESRLSW